MRKYVNFCLQLVYFFKFCFCHLRQCNFLIRECRTQWYTELASCWKPLCMARENSRTIFTNPDIKMTIENNFYWCLAVLYEDETLFLTLKVEYKIFISMLTFWWIDSTFYYYFNLIFREDICILKLNRTVYSIFNYFEVIVQ